MLASVLYLIHTRPSKAAAGYFQQYGRLLFEPCVQVAHQGPATLGIALLAMGEELGGAMAHRALEHLLQYGEPPIRHAPSPFLPHRPIAATAEAAFALRLYPNRDSATHCCGFAVLLH